MGRSSQRAAESDEQPRRRRRTKVAVPPVAAADGLATVAARRATREAVSKRGVVNRARRMTASGHSLRQATEEAAKLGKGLAAETQLAASLTSRSGLVGRKVRARPNFDPCHPTEDIIVTEFGAKVGAFQVKNGQPPYVQREIESGKYASIVANREAVAHLEQVGVLKQGEIPSCINHSGIQSAQLSSVFTRQETIEVLTSILEVPTWQDRLNPIFVAAKAGANDGAITFGLSLATQTVEDLIAGRCLDFVPMVGEALKTSSKAFVRTTVVTYGQSIEFLRRAKRAFSDRLIHAIASSTLVTSAVVDVVVDFAFDLVDVIRGKMDHETLLRNLGVNTCGAIGSVAGASIALVVASRVPWWLLLLVVAVGMWLGCVGGRWIGRRIFDEDTNANPQPAPA